MVLASAAGALALLACGGPAADLFGVQRSGSIPGANLRLVPNGDGTVKCNGHPHKLPDALLLKAEYLADGLAGPASKGKRLPSGPHPVYTYVVVTPSGTLSFSDDSPHQGLSFYRLQAWVRAVDRTVC